jgi:hypothetical protein
MRSYSIIRNLPAVLSAVIVVGTALSGAAYAISGPTFTYSTPKTGYLMIPAAAFTPQMQSTTYGNNGVTLQFTNGCFFAPVNLPQDAVMTQLSMWYRKSDATKSEFVLVLRRVTPVHESSGDVAWLDAVDTDDDVKTVTTAIAGPLAFRTVNNANYGYVLQLCLSSTEAFVSARIKYTYKTAGD